MSRTLQRFSMGALGLAVVLSLFPATALSAPRIYVNIPPPPIVVETRPPAPGPRHVWVEGYHRWDGRAYVWVPGTWRQAPRYHARWVPGHWVQTRRVWYWVGGRWR